MSASTIVTNLSNATNNDLDFTAPRDSKVFNRVGVEYLDPGAASQALAITLKRGAKDGVSGCVLSVSLATDSGASITTIASDISTAINGVKASAVITGDASATVSDGDTITIGGQTYTFKTALTASTTKNQILIGNTGSSDAALTNLSSALTGGGTPGTDYGSLTLPHALVTAGAVASHNLTVTALYPGAQFNRIIWTLSSSDASVTITGAGTLGGSGNTAGVDSTVVDSNGSPVKGWKFATVSNHSGNDGSGLVAAMTLVYYSGSTHESTTGYATVAAAKAEGWVFEGTETTGKITMPTPQNAHNSEVDLWEAYLTHHNGKTFRTASDSGAHLLIACELYVDQMAKKGKLFDWQGPYLDPDTVQS